MFPKILHCLSTVEVLRFNGLDFRLKNMDKSWSSFGNPICRGFLFLDHMHSSPDSNHVLLFNANTIMQKMTGHPFGGINIYR